jgi:phenylpropionate dioxygenase-like ring-hydroxylating dioxygenase large terminal subunit
VSGPAATGFVRNEWYVVALASEVGEELISRVVHGRSILLYRRRDGVPVALDNRCSHRGFPLASGVRRDDAVECGYHGFTFDSTGACVAVPGQAAIPSKASIRSLPIIERGPFIWAWTGDPDDVGPSTAPDSVGFDDEGWSFYTGYASIGCHYMLVVDNLLDLSHESFLHATRIGTPEVAGTPIATEVDEATHSVLVTRHMEGAECPPSYQQLTGLRTPIDRTQSIRFFAPSLYLLDNR